MIVCDECRNVEAKAFECFVVVLKQDGPKKIGNRRVKTSPRQVVSVPVALCDECVSKVCKRIGVLKSRGNLSGARSAEPEAKEDET